MRARSFQVFQVLIFSFLAVLFIVKIWDGTILNYINQRFVVIIFLGAILFVLISQAIMRDQTYLVRSQEDSKMVEQGVKRILWLLIPLVIGFFVSPSPLGVEAVSIRGISTKASFITSNSDGEIVIDIPAENRTILDWIRSYEDSNDPLALKGQEVHLVGFVYHEPQMELGEFIISRYVITCCVADAVAIGLPVFWLDGETLEEGQWVVVDGVLDIQEYAGEDTLVVSAKVVEEIAPLSQPYLFP